MKIFRLWKVTFEQFNYKPKPDRVFRHKNLAELYLRGCLRKIRSCGGYFAAMDPKQVHLMQWIRGKWDV